MDYNKPIVTPEIAKDAEKFAKCVYSVRSVNDAYGALVHIQGVGFYTVYGAPTDKKRTAMAAAIARCREYALQRFAEKSL